MLDGVLFEAIYQMIAYVRTAGARVCFAKEETRKWCDARAHARASCTEASDRLRLKPRPSPWTPVDRR